MVARPAGWYRDPGDPEQLERWWDGEKWAEHTTGPKPVVEFNAYIHSRERHPAAPGFSEAQLDDVPLVTVHPAAIPAAIGAVLLLVALAGAPYEFYIVLRWVVTAMAIWISVVAGNQSKTGWVIVFVAIAVLFNPLIPVYAYREFWIPIDTAGLALFWAAGVKLRASKPAPPGLKWSP